MSRYEDIDNEIWSDPVFSDLSPLAKLTYVWSFTNPRCGWAGIYKLTLKTAAAEIGFSTDEFVKALRELREKRFVFYSEGVLWVRSRAKHIRSKSSRMAISVARDVEKLAPDHELRIEFLKEYSSDPWLRDALPKPPQPMVSEGVSENPLDKPDSDTHPNTVRMVSRTGTGTGSSSSRTSTERSQGVRAIFDYWRARCHHPNAVLDAKRRSAIEGRLRDGYTVEQICTGIDGAARSPFVNAQGKRFDDIELVCRNAVKLDDFIERATASKVVQLNDQRGRSQSGTDYDKAAGL